MARTKKDIDAFQKAMLSNTKIIGNSNIKKNTAAKTTQTNSYSITQEMMKKYEVLAKELKIDKNEAIELALKHFLELSRYMSK